MLKAGDPAEGRELFSFFEHGSQFWSRLGFVDGGCCDLCHCRAGKPVSPRKVHNLLSAVG